MDRLPNELIHIILGYCDGSPVHYVSTLWYHLSKHSKVYLSALVTPQLLQWALDQDLPSASVHTLVRQGLPKPVLAWAIQQNNLCYDWYGCYTEALLGSRFDLLDDWLLACPDAPDLDSYLDTISGCQPESRTLLTAETGGTLAYRILNAVVSLDSRTSPVQDVKDVMPGWGRIAVQCHTPKYGMTGGMALWFKNFMCMVIASMGDERGLPVIKWLAQTRRKLMNISKKPEPSEPLAEELVITTYALCYECTAIWHYLVHEEHYYYDEDRGRLVINSFFRLG